MTPFITKSPREIYINYRDFDIGVNKFNNHKGSYAQARIWGLKYFKNNFNSLVHITTKVGPKTSSGRTEHPSSFVIVKEGSKLEQP